jgi:methylmalonyl-CoA mutase
MTDIISFGEDFPKQSREAWRQLAELELKGAPFEKRLLTKLIEGVTVQPLYFADSDTQIRAGLPGQSPLIRGGTPLGAARSGWEMIQEHRHPDPCVANLALRQDLSGGATAVVVRLSPLPLDEPDMKGCGCGGGAYVDSIEQMDALFRDIDLSRIPVSIAGGPGFYSAAALFTALLEKRGIEPKARKGSFNADPLGSLAAKGVGYRSANVLLEQAAELACVAAKEFPGITALQVSTAAYDNAGATAVQELAAAIASGVEYLRACEAAGLQPERALSQIVFSMAVGCDQFLEIAKFRAIRALWNRVEQAVGVADSERFIRVHARTSRRILTKRDPWVNLLRTTIGSFAAAVGGADQITVLPFDDVIGPSDDFARRVARNTQIVLADEVHLGRVIDAAGGSFYVETLTRQLAEMAWAAFQSIEEQGGMLAVLRSGAFKREIDATWEQRQKDLSRRKTPITGVSEYPNLGESALSREPAPTLDLERVIDANREQRAADTKICAAISKMSDLSGAERFKAATAALLLGASRLQIENGLGRNPETIIQFHLKRFATGYEKLRDASDAVLSQTGKRPRIFLANMGPIAVHTARAAYAQNFFEAGGFEAITNDGFETAEAAAAACIKESCTLAIICSSDAWYQTGAANVATTLKQAGVETLFLAGNPGSDTETYKKAGIDQFIFVGCDVLGTLTQLADSQRVLS